MLPTRLLRITFLFSFMLVALAGCGNTAMPTPTPTKTAVAAQAAPATPVPLVATDTPVPPTERPVAVEPPTPTALPEGIAPFTGLPADDPQWLKERPVFICINNDPAGRAAHYGLGLADVVYEYIVDGFIMTRITAMYQSHAASRIGPVRSARMPNIWMTYMYDGALACSGGSDEIRYMLRKEVGFPYLDADLDDPSNTVYFQNLGTDYRTRLQMSTDGMRRWLADKGLGKEWNRPGFDFSDATPGGAAGSATVITINYPGGNSLEWRYDANLGGYLRFQGGAQANDPATGQPILASNVMVIAAKHELTNMVEDSLGTKGVDIALYGFGDLRVFRDGQVYEGTWRADDEHPPRWLGPGEVVIGLKRGQSWVQVVQQLNTDLAYQ